LTLVGTPDNNIGVSADPIAAQRYGKVELIESSVQFFACGKIRWYALKMLRSPFRAIRHSRMVCTVTAQAKAAAIAGGSVMMCRSDRFGDTVRLEVVEESIMK
jgi:hypothetical protein